MSTNDWILERPAPRNGRPPPATWRRTGLSAGLTLTLLGSLAGCTGEIGQAGSGDARADAGTRTGTNPTRTGTTSTTSIPGRDGGVDTTAPAAPEMRRLTTEQYRNSIDFLFQGAVEVPSELEPISQVNGFVAVGASRSTISPRGVELFETAALDVADRAFASASVRSAIVPCSPSTAVDEACARDFVTQFGRLVFRRPLSSDEVSRYATIATDSARILGDFHEGLALATAGMLQSPNFLFRAEQTEVVNGVRRYTDLDMASRLSFLVLNGPPDDALLDAAENGELTSETGLRAQTLRLLSSVRSEDAIRAFFTDMLHLDGLSQLPQDPELFGQMSPTLGDSMRESLLRTIEELLVNQGRPYSELFTTTTVYVNQELADLYGLDLQVPDGEWTRAEFPADGPRAGLLSHAGLLALYSHSNASSPTLRGKFVRETLLCQSIPPPPANVGELPSPSPELRTMRERLAAHRENPACAACHQITDPIGLGLENFDAIGAYRERENDALIDASGELDGVDFADAASLGDAISKHAQLSDCLVRNLYRYGTGHVESSGETPTIAALRTTFEMTPDFDALLVALVTSDGFRYAGDSQ